MAIPTNAELMATLGSQADVCGALLCPRGTAARILDLCEYPGGGADEFVAIARTDGALTARLLRIANSPAHGQEQHIYDVAQAISVVGIEITRQQALDLALASSLRPHDDAAVNYPQFWRRSLATALANRLLAEHAGVHNSEHYLVAGLLQDCGMMLLAELKPEVYGHISAYQHNHGAVIAAEQTAFGADHTQAGGWLLDSWHLPAAYGSAARGSHTPAAIAVPPEDQPLVYCTAAAAAIADILFSGEEHQAVRRALAIGLEHSQLTPQSLRDLLPQLLDELQAASRVHELDLGSHDMLARRVATALELIDTLPGNAAADQRLPPRMAS